jgi:hypothetical protein
MYTSRQRNNTPAGLIYILLMAVSNSWASKCCRTRSPWRCGVTPWLGRVQAGLPSWGSWEIHSRVLNKVTYPDAIICQHTHTPPCHSLTDDTRYEDFQGYIVHINVLLTPYSLVNRYKHSGGISHHRLRARLWRKFSLKTETKYFPETLLSNNYATRLKVAGSIPVEVAGFFNLTSHFQPHYAAGVDSASNRNEYLGGLKAASA